MPRSGEQARRRLQQAALELFGERGYEATTTAEIAARAGVTERTFFRHFADKREALFDGEETFRAVLSDAVIAAPADLGPIEALLAAFRSVEPLLRANLPFTAPRQALIARSPALQERVLTKTAALTDALADALTRRGLERGAAMLAAQVGMAVFSHATRAWFGDPAPGLEAHLERALNDLRALS
jgi:AcrR family transcriptional regulator